MDAGAAHHMVHVARLLADSGDYAVTAYTCHAARGVFQTFGAESLPFDTVPRAPRAPTAADLDALNAAADRIIADLRPDLVIGGLSNTGNGPDEAFGAAARRAGLTTVTLLDDRGPLQSLDGGNARHLLATSRAIETWAGQVPDATVHFVGSLKHHALSLLPADEIRRRVRDKMGLGDDTKLVTFIAQTDAMEGHNERFVDLVEILDRDRDRLPPFRLVVRVHPGAPRAGEWCFAEAERRGLDAACDRDGDINQLLAASDALFSCSSTSMTDYVWLSLGGGTLRAVPIYLLGGEAIREWLVKLQGTWEPDLVTRGLALMATDNDELEKYVQKSLCGTLRAPNAKKEILREIDDPFETFAETISTLIPG